MNHPRSSNFAASPATRRVLDQLAVAKKTVRQTGDGWTCQCPAHLDRSPSLSVREGDDGRTLVHCFAGCSAESICGALGLSLHDLFNANPNASGPASPAPLSTPSSRSVRVYRDVDTTIGELSQVLGALVGRWDYHDATNRVVGAVARFEGRALGGKEIRPLTMVEGGWVQRGMAAPRPLYGLPSLNAADQVLILEGEKCAEAARTLGFIATTSAGGSNAARLTDWSPLAGKRCIIVPDNDAAGEHYLDSVLTELATLEPRPTVSVLRLPGLSDGQDLVEFAAGFGSDAARCRRTIEELIDRSPTIDPGPSTNLRPAENIPLVIEDEPWPEPAPLPPALAPVIPFDPQLLPDVLRPWIVDIAESMQCPMDFPAATAIIAIAGVVGRKIGIRPKMRDSWTEIPNLWGVLIGRPSAMKSPPLKRILSPVMLLAQHAHAEHLESLLQHDQAAAIAKIQHESLEATIRERLKRKQDASDLTSQLQALSQRATGGAPSRRRHVVNDSTYQALGEILSHNPNGIIIVRDELSGLLKSLENENQKEARSFYLESWSGDQRYEVDRIGRGNIIIPALCTSIIGTTQPGPLSQYLNAAMRGGAGDDGLMQRFQIAVWPDDRAEWINIDREPDHEAEARVNAVFERLDRLRPEDVQAQTTPGNPNALPYLRFTQEAYERFIRWMEGRENRQLRRLEHPAIESHLTKYRKLVPALALLFHLVDGGVGPVGLPSLQRALDWSVYLESHARRIYSPGIEPGRFGGRVLAEKLAAGELDGEVTVRALVRKKWSQLSTQEEVELALQFLADLDWLRVEKVGTRGRPSLRVILNPRLREGGPLSLPLRAGAAVHPCHVLAS